MTILVADVMAVVRDRLTTETITDAALLRYIAGAVRRYSRFNPVLTRTSFTTVADQQLYALATGATGVVEVQFWPSGGLSATLSNKNEWLEMLYVPSHYDLISERVGEDIKEGEYIRRIKGGYWIENKN